MKDALARARSYVEHGAISILDVSFARKLGRDHMAVSNIVGIFRLGFL
jgi:hypothetical protein